MEFEDDDHTIVAKREALEETRCEVDVKPVLVAKTFEWRGNLKQESYAYACTVTKDTGRVTLTE